MNDKIIPIQLSVEEYSEAIENVTEINPNDYELRRTNFESVYKIIDKKNKLRYTSSIDKIHEKEILYNNISDKNFLKLLQQDNPLITSDDYQYLKEITNAILDMFLFVEVYYPRLYKTK